MRETGSVFLFRREKLKLFTFVFGINSYFCTVQFSTTVSKWTHHTWIADCETLSSTSSAPFSSLAPPLFPPPSPPLRSCYLVCIFCFPPVIFGQAGKQPFGALPTPISTMKVNLTHIHTTPLPPAPAASHPAQSNSALSAISHHLLQIPPRLLAAAGSPHVTFTSSVQPFFLPSASPPSPPSFPSFFLPFVATPPSPPPSSPPLLTSISLSSGNNERVGTA